MAITPEQHARAMARGAWQCPACALGFQRFEITEDLNICPNCGYHGGDIPEDSEVRKFRALLVEIHNHGENSELHRRIGDLLGAGPGEDAS